MAKQKTQQRGPWQRLSQETVYENPWIEVTHEEVITPGNTDGIYGVVHFKNRAVGIVPIDKQGNTRLVGQYRYTLDKFSWEIPEGGAGADEFLLPAAQRELKEETGLYGGQWLQILNLHLSNSITDEEGYVFLAQDLEQGEQSLEASESDLVVKTLPLQDAIQMALKGEITDVLSVAALLAVSQYASSK
jgi:8-oxo-dGTP pyrophosphatase MutT (NUDIX family)